MSNNTNCWYGRTAYQIMPDRFCKIGEEPIELPDRVTKSWNDRMPNWQPASDGEYYNNYFYGGNLKGIISKLDYLRNLGFDLIYLTPIEFSFSNHHYDPGNHLEIDPWLGTWLDFEQLCEQAHERGMLVVVDLVFNHVGIHSIYYEDIKYADWIKRDAEGNPINWWNFKDLEECDTHNSEYQEEMTKVVRKFLSMGADGIRLDLGENLPKDFLQAIGRVRTEYPDVIFIGEMWGIATDKSEEDAKILDGQLDSVMNYPISDAILRWIRWGYDGHFKYNYERVYGEYPVKVQNVLLNNVATHDTPTTMSILVADGMNGNVFDGQIWDIEAPWRSETGFDTYGFRKFECDHDIIEGEKYILGKMLTKIAISLLYTIPGIPCVFQGTEIADTGYKDPFNRKPFDWEKDEPDMIQFVKTMGQYRHENRDILAEGKNRIIRVDSEVIVIERYLEEGGHIYLAVNRTNNPQSIMIPDDGTESKIIYSNGKNSKTELDRYGIYIVRQ